MARANDDRYPVRITIDDDGTSYRVELTSGVLFDRLGPDAFTVQDSAGLRDRIIKWLKRKADLVGVRVGDVHVNSSSRRHPSCLKCGDDEGLIRVVGSSPCEICGGAGVIFPEFAPRPTH